MTVGEIKQDLMKEIREEAGEDFKQFFNVKIEDDRIVFLEYRKLCICHFWANEYSEELGKIAVRTASNLLHNIKNWLI